MKQRHRFKLNSLLSCMLLAGALPAVYAAEPQETAEVESKITTTTKEITADEAEIEVIKVSGYRSSINAALLSKRAAVGSKETIIAEDIGKFPDLNVADSLSRIPGIAIEEDAGEGRQITVRGLGSRYVKTTINGMESASAGAATDAAGGSNKSRAFDFNVFASELFTQIDVYKTSSAELEDGGISGNVNLQTARPFQYDDTQFAYNVNASYNDAAEEVSPRVSFMASKNWNDTFGGLVSVAYSKNKVQSEGATTVRWTVNNPLYVEDGASISEGGNNYLTAKPKTVMMENGNYTNENMNGLYLPRIPRYSIFSKEQERLGVTAALQFAPTDNFEMQLDILHADLNTTMDEYEYSVLLRDQKNIVPENLYIDDNNTIVAGSFSDAIIRSETRQDISESNFDQITFGGDWQINDSMRLTFMLGKGQSDLEVPHSRTFALDSTGSTVAYSYDDSINPLDLINNTGGVTLNQGSMTTGIPSFAFAPGAAPGGTYTKEQLEDMMIDSSNYSVGLVRNRAQTIESDNTSFKIDFAYDINDELTLKVGANKRVFETEQHDYRNDWKNLDKETNKTSGAKAEVQVVDLAADIIAGDIYGTTLADLGAHFGNTLSVPSSSTLHGSTWLTPDYGTMMNTFSSYDFFEAKEAYKRGYAIKEDVFALYAQLDFRYDIFDRELRGNIGLRYIDNENTSKIVNLDDIYKDGSTAGRGEGANYPGGYRWRTSVSEGDDILPSLNLAYDITDNVILRFSYAEAITRAKLSDLSSAISVNVPDEQDPSAEIKLGAGPTLEPYKSEQFDIGVEWYFAEESLLAGTVFFKDISGLTKESSDEVLTSAQLDALGIDIGDMDPSTITWQVTQLTNTKPEDMWGAEFIYQQPFSFLPSPFDNLGLQANYTYIDYTRDIEDPFYGTQLELVEEETSKNTYNITVYYEVDDWSARFSYNFREGYNKQYLSEYADESTFVRGYEDKKKLNFSARYNLMENMSLSFEAINLTNESQDQWNDIYTPRPYENLTTGRQYLLGLRGSF
ncbi:TonB-dependent receptor [Shewanella sp. A14]